MRAIIETGGKQFTVAPNETIRVPSLTGEPGETITLDRVVYAADEGGIHVGTPVVEGAQVRAEIVKHGRGDKIVVFKFKRRKRYKKKQGHRQNFTELRITDVAVPTKSAATATESDETFVCQECGKEYKTERGLSQHLVKAHESPEAEE